MIILDTTVVNQHTIWNSIYMFKLTVVKPTIDQSSYSIPKSEVYHGIPNAIGFYWGWFMVGFTTLLPQYIHHISREWSIYPAPFSQQNCLTWIICALFSTNQLIQLFSIVFIIIILIISIYSISSLYSISSIYHIWILHTISIILIISMYSIYHIHIFHSYFHIFHMGVSENSVPLNPIVNDHYPYEKWLFHWEYIYPTFSDKPK